MGRGARQKPEFLSSKLRDIRLGLGLSQGGMVDRLIEINRDLAENTRRERVSAYENGEREPNLLTLKAYAEAAGVSTDDLIDDHIALPKTLPATKHARGPSGKSRKSQAKAAMNTTAIILHLLQIRSENDIARAENRVRATIEKVHLKKHGMKKLKNGDYELTFSHEDEEDLDEQIYFLLMAIKSEARRLKCSVDIDIEEKGGDRYW